MKHIVVFLAIGILFSLRFANADEPLPLVRDTSGKVLLEVYRCGDQVPDFSEWKQLTDTRYLNEDGSGELTRYFVDNKDKRGMGLAIDLIHTDGSREPMYHTWHIATPQEVIAYTVRGEWRCFSGTVAPWLGIFDRVHRGKMRFYYRGGKDWDMLIKSYEVEGEVLRGKKLVWNWKPPLKEKYWPDLPEITLAEWTIR